MKTKTITKEKIAEHLQETLGLSGVICENLVSQIFESATDLICEHSYLTIKNFGSFEIKHKKSRPGVNLSTMEPKSISERKVVTFTPSRSLKAKLNHMN